MSSDAKIHSLASNLVCVATSAGCCPTAKSKGKNQSNHALVWASSLVARCIFSELHEKSFTGRSSRMASRSGAGGGMSP